MCILCIPKKEKKNLIKPPKREVRKVDYLKGYEDSRDLQIPSCTQATVWKHLQNPPTPSVPLNLSPLTTKPFNSNLSEWTLAEFQITNLNQLEFYSQSIWLWWKNWLLFF